MALDNKLTYLSETEKLSTLYLDFSNMEYDKFFGIFYFPVDYLREQLNVPGHIDDSYLVGENREVNNKLCARSDRARAMIRRALDSGWIDHVPDYIWRHCFITSKANIPSNSQNYQHYELMPGTGYGAVLIKGGDHRIKIMDLAIKGYYVTRKIDTTSIKLPAIGKRFGNEVILIPESSACE